MINFLLLVSRQGKTRLSKWYDHYQSKEKARITRELTTLVLARPPKMCNFLEWRDKKVRGLGLGGRVCFVDDGLQGFRGVEGWMGVCGRGGMWGMSILPVCIHNKQTRFDRLADRPIRSSLTPLRGQTKSGGVQALRLPLLHRRGGHRRQRAHRPRGAPTFARMRLSVCVYGAYDLYEPPDRRIAPTDLPPIDPTDPAKSTRPPPSFPPTR